MPSTTRDLALDTPAGQRTDAHGHDHAGHEHAGHGHAAHDHGIPACCGHDHGQPAAPVAGPAWQAGPGQQVTRVRIGQMDCPTEETLIRKKLAGLPEVHELDFNLMQRVLTVLHADGALDRIDAAIRSLGMTPEPLAADAPAAPAGAAAPARGWRLLAAGGVLAALSEVAHFTGQPVYVAAALALAAILACGLSTYRKGWIAVRNGNLNINALMSIAVTGAMLIGQWPEAAMVMFLFNVAELIEARALDRARNAVRGLLDLAPQTATMRQSDGTWIEVPATRLRPGDLVRVRPGERIAADGAIVEGQSAIDQSPITGESLPVEKGVDDEVYAGTVNASGSFDYRVTAAAGNTTLDRIIHAVEQAQGARAPTQRFIDRFSRIYTPAVVGLAVLVALAPPLLLGHAWLDSVYRALALLIIACPCALVISTPVSVVSGLTAAARRGILIKGGVYLEEGRKLRWLALDKTGTLTQGKPVQTDLELLHDASAGGRPALRAAVSLAARSDHPVSRALAQADHALDAPLDDVDGFAALPGRGVQGEIGGERFQLGNRRLMRELGVGTPEIEARIDAYEAAGKTAIALTDGQRVLLVAAVADTLKASSAAAVADLHRLGVRTLMLTGDNTRAAQAVAAQAGIDEARGDLLPQDKLDAVQAKLDPALRVGMVGDGINDAPALARADIGFAMGAAGTGTAIETADVALMDDDLRKIGTFVRLSRATHRILTQNIALALGIKAVFLVLAMAGQATLWMAVFADVGASLLVVANGLRLLRAGGRQAS
ncbi:heavy metal translocating P-type ATPase [Bordetella bronchiseptica]|uniref:heavy metal translocating P-type ATPase n=1 Tax=Bordetella bronchiseptica TaxID=518 RepID=UPI00081CBD0D|nr:heavy metal translocating P-type ATPase [Bordetella bronchiseptica]AOB27114.1 copper-translocating P-type ATPase [Bordetella bronchiseptica]AZW44427.1 copper-translocating P-type ATPase [Bordetella bronchiseptica]